MPARRTARAGSASNAPSSQNTSTQRACGAQASRIGPVTSATYAATSVPDGATWEGRREVDTPGIVAALGRTARTIASRLG